MIYADEEGRLVLVLKNKPGGKVIACPVHEDVSLAERRDVILPFLRDGQEKLLVAAVWAADEADLNGYKPYIVVPGELCREALAALESPVLGRIALTSEGEVWRYATPYGDVDVLSGPVPDHYDPERARALHERLSDPFYPPMAEA